MIKPILGIDFFLSMDTDSESYKLLFARVGFNLVSRRLSESNSGIDIGYVT